MNAATTDDDLYRRHFLRVDARRAVLVIGVTSAIQAISLHNDHRLFGWSRQFHLLVWIRVASWLIAGGLAALLLRTKEPRTHDLAIASFLVSTVASFAYITSTRPPEYLGYAVASTMGVFMLYLITPGALLARSAAALTLSVVTFWASVQNPTPSMGLTITLATHVLSHALGIPVARWFDALRRDGFFAQLKEQRAREELARKARDLELASERAERMSKAKSDFLATMSHEIRTPMNAVLGLSSSLAEAPLASHHREMVRTIQQSARSLLVLLNDILDLAKVEAGRLTIEKDPFDLRQAVHAAADLVRHQAIEKGLTIDVAIAPEVPAALFGDAIRLRQVLVNLLSNAVKFTDRGQISVRVEPVRRHGEEHEIRFTVEDTGIGIAPEALTRLFAPYEQAGASAEQKSRGAGLGLAICKQLVGLMGGDIGVRSEVGRGSTFELTIRAPEARSPPRSPRMAETGGVGLPPLRILVVDDNAINRQVAAALLQRLGASADFAEDGEEALGKVPGGRYDLVFMDLRMPGMDGVETTRRLRAALPGGELPRIIAMTASAFEDDRMACYQAGMEDFISKPVLPEDLHAVLLRASAGKKHLQRPEEDRDVTLSRERLATLRGLETADSPGFFEDLCRDFFAQAATHLDRLAEAAAHRDATTLEREAHTLKSVAAMFGAMALSARCADIEAAAASGDASADASRVEWLREELGRVRQAMTSS